jgi:hypothetical protein
MDSQLAIGVLWKNNGMVCLLRRLESGWWVTLENADALVKRISVPGPREGIATGRQWAEEYSATTGLLFSGPK